MSRASWYRHDKPTEKRRRITRADQARQAGLTLRTFQRFERVLAADMDLFVLMARDGWCKPGQAEQIIAKPSLHRHFRKWLKAEKAGNTENAKAEMGALVIKMAAAR
jgi:hypothetical protein